MHFAYDVCILHEFLCIVIGIAKKFCAKVKKKLLQIILIAVTIMYNIQKNSTDMVAASFVGPE